MNNGEHIMFKNIGLCFAFLVLAFNVLNSFAISPDAGQPQVQNNRQAMDENPKRIKEMKETTPANIPHTTTAPKQSQRKLIQNH